MFPHGSFCLTGWSGIFLSASLYAFSSFFFCCCSAAICSSLFCPSLPPPPCPPIRFRFWACAGTVSTAIIAAIAKALISTIHTRKHLEANVQLRQIRDLERHPRSALALRRSFGRECSRRGSSDIAGRRRRNIARADLYRLTCIPDDAACNVVDSLGCPVAPGSVNGLCVTWIHHIAWRSGGDDGPGDHSATDDTGGNARPPSPSPASPLGGDIRRSCGQR